MEAQAQVRPDRTLSFKRVRELTDLSRTTVWRLQRRGDFPQPIRISPGRVGWLERDILAWQLDRAGELRAFGPLPERPPPPARASRVKAVLHPAAATAVEAMTTTTAPTPKTRRNRPPALEQLGFEF